MNILKNKLGASLVALGLMLTGGVVAGATALASAQSTSTTTVAPASTTATSQTVDTPEAGDVADATSPKTHGHAPLGGDGVVSSVSGTTIIIGEESNEGSASYTVDASKATITANGAAGTIADVKVGEKIFVQGTVSGTSVAATSISVGHPGEWGGKDKANDTDGSSASEASEPASSSDAGDQ